MDRRRRQGRDYTIDRRRRPTLEHDAVGLGVLVRAGRQQLGWRQTDLAERLGVDKAYISAIETGQRKWPASHVRELRDLLGLDYVEMAIAAKILPEEARRTNRGIAFSPEDPMYEAMVLGKTLPLETRVLVREFVRFVGQQGEHDQDEQTEPAPPQPARTDTE